MKSKTKFKTMYNDTNLPQNERLSSAENDNDSGMFWQNLFDYKSGALWLGIGLFLILCNVVVIFGIDTRPNAWLFYLNMNYWPLSVPIAIILWAITIWAASESTNTTEKHLPFIRIATLTCISFAIIFALRSYFDTTSSFIWFVIVAIIVACAVRSLFLLYIYRYGKDESIDLEEARWFWGLSGFIFVVLLILGVMSIIPVKIQIHAGSSEYGSMSLFTIYYAGLIDLVQQGQGSLGLRLLGILLAIGTVSFIYVASKWLLICLSKIKEE